MLNKFFSEKNPYKTKDPVQHLSMLNNLANRLAPVLRSQNGVYIRKIWSPVVERKLNKKLVIDDAYAHLVVGKKRVILSTCIYNNHIEAAQSQFPFYNRADLLVCSNGTFWITVDINRLYNDCQFNGDNDFEKIKKILTSSWINPRYKNFCLTIPDLEYNGYIVNYGRFIDDTTYEGHNQDGVWGIHKMEFKDNFGKIHDTRNLPVKFTKVKLHGVTRKPKYLACRLEMSDSDLYREYKIYTDLKSMYNEFAKADPNISKYRAFTKVCASTTEKAMNNTIGQHPKVYRIRYDVHYIVMDNIGLEKAFAYVRKVKARLDD